MSQFTHMYQNTRWRKRRAEQLRVEPLCRYCLARGIATEATVADHVVPHKGDLTLFWEGKLASLCASCHSGAKQAEENSGILRGGDIHGNPLDARHHWNKAD